jgi:hypothetical protein
MKKTVTLLLLFITFLQAHAQDVIVKNDKSEIKAKVLEIDDVNVKYKQWDFQDGPTYSVRKNEVFMILYKNGKRETFEQSAPAPTPQPQQAAPSWPSATPNQPAQPGRFDIQQTGNEVPEPKLDLLRTAVNIDGLSNDFLIIRAEVEAPIFKSRYFYYGTILATNIYTGPADFNGSFLIGLSGTVRVPLNYMTNPDPKQSLAGLIPFFKGYYLSNFENIGFSYDAGVDWLFAKRNSGGAFGVSAFTTEFVSFSLGLTWSF